jgi:hypothetical protein
VCMATEGYGQRGTGKSGTVEEFSFAREEKKKMYVVRIGEQRVADPTTRGVIGVFQAGAWPEDEPAVPPRVLSEILALLGGPSLTRASRSC